MRDLGEPSVREGSGQQGVTSDNGFSAHSRYSLSKSAPPRRKTVTRPRMSNAPNVQGNEFQPQTGERAKKESQKEADLSHLRKMMRLVGVEPTASANQVLHNLQCRALPLSYSRCCCCRPMVNFGYESSRWVVKSAQPLRKDTEII